LGTDSEGRTAWQSAATYGMLEILHKIWECAEANLTTEEVKSNLLLGTDNKGMTAWLCAAGNCNLEKLHKIYEVAE